MRQFQENRQKFKELILYISQRAARDENYGSTHLNKLLFFADFIAYAKFGQPITGTEYMREKRGPVPRAVRSGDKNPVRELMRDGRLTIKETPLDFNRKRITPIPLKPADTSVFSQQELDLVDSVVDSFFGWTAGKLSKYTHELPQWHAVALLETIPYELVFVAQDQRFSEAETKHGLELAQRHGWPLSRNGR